MKKWYKQAYFDRKIWIIENFDKLNLSAEEAMLILLIDYAKDTKKKINYDFLCSKLGIDTRALDKILSGLVGKHYLSINTNEKGISFDFDNIFEFDPEKYEVIENKNIYDIAEELVNKPLTPAQLQKINELLDKYDENRIIDAIRTAEAYRKTSLDYVEGILRNENKQ
ncbi:MAG: DnaD domain protein [Erysipelotrichaceae bacterium]|nr:DnaD domain protein [Erysipelotrichaceae bacterium]